MANQIKIVVSDDASLFRPTRYVIRLTALITQGHSKQQAWQIVSKAQPLCVDKPYMHIALELFEAELDKSGIDNM